MASFNYTEISNYICGCGMILDANDRYVIGCCSICGSNLAFPKGVLLSHLKKIGKGIIPLGINLSPIRIKTNDHIKTGKTFEISGIPGGKLYMEAEDRFCNQKY